MRKKQSFGLRKLFYIDNEAMLEITTLKTTNMYYTKTN